MGRYARKTACMPPLGLLTIAALCPRDWEVRIIDENVEKLKDEDFDWADLMGVTAMIVQYDQAVFLARKAKQKGIPSLIGGPHVTGEPEVYEREFDILALNEGEITFRSFLADYEMGDVKARYETEAKADLSQTPLARYDLLRHRRRYMNFCVQFSRGCPHSCEFCDVTRSFGRQLRTRSIEGFLGELEAILDCGYRGPVFVADDNFTANRKKALDLLMQMDQWNVRNGNPFTYYTQADIGLANQDSMLEALQKARFNGVFIGLETPSQESLKSAGKLQNMRVDTKAAIRKIQSHGLRVDGGFIVGFDDDTEKIFQQQVDYIESINMSAAMVGILTAPPSSAMYDRLKREGRLLREHTPLSPSFYLENYNIGGLMNVIPKQYPLTTLMEGYAYLLSRIYDPARYFDRVVRQISELAPAPSNWRTAARSILLRLPLLTFFVLLFFPCRFQYLRAALRVVLRYPNRLEQFTMLVLRGIHYIEVTRREVVPWAQREAGRVLCESGLKSSETG